MTDNSRKANNSAGSILVLLLFVFALFFLMFSFLFLAKRASGAKDLNQGIELKEQFTNLGHLDSQLSVLQINNQPNECLFREGSDRDTDGDGVVDSCDNCPYYGNSDQSDTNNNGVGDVCDNKVGRKSSGGSSSDEGQIICAFNSDCGTDGFIGSNFCSASGNLSRIYMNFTCINPGTTQSSCSSSSQEKLISVCALGCLNSSCLNPVNITCTTNSQCNDNNSSTYDVCNNPGTPQSFCSHNPIACFANSNCGTSGFQGAPFCQGNNILRVFANYTCNFPGTSQSTCSSSNSTQQVSSCQYACSSGACVRCNSNLDCNDSNTSTADICENPGTQQSSCINPQINCFTNSDCGTDGFSGNAFCSSNNVSRNFTSYTCNNAGTASSFCSSTLTQLTTQTCNFACQNGACVTFACTTNSQCNDQNPLTFDECINPGTIVSQCRNTPINCASNLDCGVNGYVGGNFCSTSGNVIRNFVTYTCSNAGTTSSFCSSSVSQPTQQMCVHGCANGACVTPAVVCGNGVLESGEQCDDGNLVNNDGCSSSCQIETPPQCTNQCTQGDRQCLDSQHYRICADFNGDGCTEWSLTATCGALSSCVNGRCN